MEEFSIISFKNIHKYYRMHQHGYDRFLGLLGVGDRHRQYFTALNNITFSIKKGESVGILGVNGAGKSTLLKILCGIVAPSSGTVTTKGRISGLLELGAGFHPERTGLENIYFQGAIQGLPKKQVQEMIPEIVSFAGIGDFIHQPIKVYSSGMFVRLAFAVAIQTKPDILIVDEALAVGDLAFQRRCFQKIEDMKKDGVTFIFVSHAVEQIASQCTRAMLLSDGELVMDGEPRPVINQYLDRMFGRDCIPETKEEKSTVVCSEYVGNKEQDREQFFNDKSLDDLVQYNSYYNPYEYRWGDGRGKILNIHMESNNDIGCVRPGDRITINVKAHFKEDVYRPIWGFNIKTHNGITIFGTNSEINSKEIPYELVKANSFAYISLEFICNLAPGEYFVSLGLAVGSDAKPLDRRYDVLLIAVHGPANFYGLGNLHMEIKRLSL